MPANDAIIIESIIHAPIEKVWRAWTDSSFILKWFGSDPNGKGLKATMDVKHGGSFEISFANADGTEHTCYGIYKEVEKFSKLYFTWNWENEPGVESFVTILLSPKGDFTEMHFEHINVGTASAHNYLLGWQSTFEKLERILAKQKNTD